MNNEERELKRKHFDEFLMDLLARANGESIQLQDNPIDKNPVAYILSAEYFNQLMLEANKIIRVHKGNINDTH